MTSGASASRNEGDCSVTTEIEADRTVVVVEGTRDVAVVVNSAAGERVYLPPEPTGGAAGSRSAAVDDSPYEGIPTDSPYEGIPTESPYEGLGSDSPYEGIPTDSPYEGISTESPYEGIADDSDEGSTRGTEDAYGVVPTEDGFRIVHPEPATDVRFLR